ncbi:cytochrome-c oxidase [Inquilinus limosus]|uniref:cytochrome-c oxidase n=1 Tax=Inquilinus limosus TaxID=171674 RepID=UPI003F185CA9
MVPASLHLRAAVGYAAIGMTMGMAMAARQDFSLMPAHAHLNLLGWVSASLYGLFLRLHPEAGSHRVQWIHFVLAHFGVVSMTAGLVFIAFGRHAVGETLAIIGGTLSIAGILLFATLVFRAKTVIASAKGKYGPIRRLPGDHAVPSIPDGNPL